MGDATDEVTPYVELIRTELQLKPDIDPVAELATRLSPEDPHDRPPARAPAVLRLGRAVWSLRRHRVPAASIETMTRDLRVLKLFDPDDPWPDESLDRLLTDVKVAKPRRSRTTAEPAHDPKVVRMKPRGRR